MKSDKLQDAIGNIREEYIEEAHADAPAEIRVESIKTAQVNAAKRRRRVLRTALPLAACLLVAVGLMSKGMFAKKSEAAPEAYGQEEISDSIGRKDPEKETLSQKADGEKTYGDPYFGGSLTDAVSSAKWVFVKADGGIFFFPEDMTVMPEGQTDEASEISLVPDIALIPEASARQLLAEGIFCVNSGESPAYFGENTIRGVKLLYYSSPNFENYVPYYCFSVEDPVMSAKEGKPVVKNLYVPAAENENLQELPGTELR